MVFTKWIRLFGIYAVCGSMGIYSLNAQARPAAKQPAAKRPAAKQTAVKAASATRALPSTVGGTPTADCPDIDMMAPLGPVTCKANTIHYLPGFVPPFYLSVQDCLDVGANSNSAMPWVIEVQPGIYEENLVINQDDFPNGLQLLAVETPLSPQAVFQSVIDGSGSAEPCIRVIGSGTSSAPIVIGGLDGANWRGLRLTGGTGANNLTSTDVMGGGGVRADNVTNLTVVGSVVTGNNASQRGGGIYFNASSGLINHCLVNNNTSGAMPTGPDARQGAGVAQVDGHLRINRSGINSNQFEVPNGNSLILGNRRGGGVWSNLDGNSSLTMCFNDVLSNNAMQGGGVAIEFRRSAYDHATNMIVSPTAHLEHNRIRANMAWEPPATSVFFSGIPGYAGGGVFVQNDEDNLMVDTGGALRLYNNLIHENLMESSSFGINAPDGNGGGVYIDLQFGVSPNAPMPMVTGSVQLTGNALFHNSANRRGGGLFYCVVSSTQLGTLGDILNNTIVYNTLDSAMSAQGTGLYIAGNSSFVGYNNIIFYNESLASPGWEWVWAPPMDAQSFMGFSQMVTYPELNPISMGFDLFNSSAENDNSSGCVLAQHLPNTASNTPCVDLGAPINLPISLDVEEGPRVVGFSIDRGADENGLSKLFIRGDANQDGSVNIADSVFVLEYMFIGGDVPPVLDAADVNDDGTINLADAVYLNNYLFSGGPPPTAPFAHSDGQVCSLARLGHDPTPDSLSTPGPYFCQ